MQMPEYRRTFQSPFTVGRWWDPADTSGEWCRGDRVLLKLEGYSAARLCSKLPRRLDLVTLPRSERWVEIHLPGSIQAGVHSLDYDIVVTADGDAQR
jgi:hypothetical protein